jgi:hypothetical protein
MVRDRLDDGVRIAQLLASELGSDAVRPPFSVTDADPDVDPTADGALAYRVVLEHDEDDHEGSGHDEGNHEDSEHPDGEQIASVFVQPDRVHVAFRRAPDAAAESASEAGLRTRPKAVRPPQTLVFVEDGAAVKRVLPVFTAVAEAVEA